MNISKNLRNILKMTTSFYFENQIDFQKKSSNQGS